MAKNTKIIVAGIGGVGGFFGGLLARAYQKDSSIEIVFLSRGEHLQKIKQHGLLLIDNGEEQTIFPTLATDNAKEAGIADFILVCCKGYDLDNMLKQLQPCINASTIILPLLNGVDSSDRIIAMQTGAMVLTACVYVVARLKEAGVIENNGYVQKIYFGSKHIEAGKLTFFEKILIEAGINAVYTDDIMGKIWEKYVFIAPIATATSLYNRSIGALAEDPTTMKNVATLVEEVIAVAKKKNIPLPEDIYSKTINRIQSLPYANTSSMHLDFRKGKGKTELGSLTGYVIELGKQWNVPTPAFAEAYRILQAPGLY